MTIDPPRVVRPASEPVGARPRTQSRVGRYLLIGLGAFFACMLLCSGSAYMLYRRFNADSNFGGSYSELREPTGGVIPERVRMVTAEATPVETPETEELVETLNDYGLEIDLGRFIMEMQRSGKSRGTVNPFTRSLMRISLGEAITPPELGSKNALLSFEWLVPDREARAVVASLSEYDQSDSIYVLYLKRSGDEWKLFDWRDVLAPMNESEYWAIYMMLPERKDDVYSRFTYEAADVCSNYESTERQRIDQLMAIYRGTTFPTQYIALAKQYMCATLANLDANEELKKLTDNISPSEFAGAYIYKAIAANGAGETEKAFGYLTELHRLCGWHPYTASLAMSYAETPEQKQLAAKWLQRTLLLAPGHSIAAELYLQKADAEQAKSLFAALAKTQEPSAKLMELCNAIGTLNEAKLNWVLDEMKSHDEFRDSTKLMELQLAMARNDFSSILSLSPEVLADGRTEQIDFYYLRQSIFASLLEAALKTNSLEATLGKLDSDDNLMFCTLLRDQVSLPNSEIPLDESVACFKSITSDTEFFDDWRTQAAIALLQVRHGDAGTAFDAMRELYEKRIAEEEDESEYSEYEDEYSSQSNYLVLNAMAKAAWKSDRWSELAEVLDAEAAFLVLASDAQSNASKLQRAVDWYSTQPNCVQQWPRYFQSKIAFLKGDWASADRLLVEAIALAKADSRLEDDSLPSIVSDYIPYDFMYEYDHDLVENWSGMRLEYAARCEALDELIAAVQASGELNADFLEKMDSYLDTPSVTTQERVASLLRAAEVDGSLELASEIDVRVAAARGRIAEALDRQITVLRSDLQSSSIEAQMAIQRAGELLLIDGSSRHLESLRQLSRGSKMAGYVDCVSALIERNASALESAVKEWKKSEWYENEFLASPEVLKHLQAEPQLRDVMKVQPVDLLSLENDCISASVLLAEDPKKSFDAFQQFCESKGLKVEPLDAARFHGCEAACFVSKNNGKLLLTFSPINVVDPGYDQQDEDVMKGVKSIVEVVLVDFVGDGTHGRIRLRTGVNAILGGMPSSVAFCDSNYSSIYHADEWQSRLADSLESGIDPGAPEERYLSLMPVLKKGLVERNGQSFAVLQVGTLCELIPIGSPTQETPWREMTAVTSATSLILPQLTEGSRVRLRTE